MSRTVTNPSLMKRQARTVDVGIAFDDFGAFVDHCQALPENRRIDTSRSSWVDNLDYAETCQTARTGDLSRVPASDEMLSKLEDLANFEARQMKTFDALAGGVPNVGAFLAGSPVNMRQRRRVATQAAPLNVIVDLGSSASVSSKTLALRGAAILAFVRIMSAQRPVNLYLGVAFSPYSAAKEISCGGLAVRIDTSPLDLARAAFAISGAAFPRQMCYSALMNLTKCNNTDSLPFPYEDVSFYRRNLHTFWQRIVSEAATEDTAVIPPLYGTDRFDNAEQWLRDMVAQYSAPTAD